MAEVTGDLGGQPIQLNNAATEATLKQLLAAMLAQVAATGKGGKGNTKVQKELEAELTRLAAASKAERDALDKLSKAQKESLKIEADKKKDADAEKKREADREKAHKDQKDRQDNFIKGMGAVAGGMSALGGALSGVTTKAIGMMSSLAGAGNSLTAAAASFQQIPIVGGVLGSVFGAVAGAADKTYKSFQQAASVGANFNGSITGMINAASGAGLTFEQFSGIIAKNGQALAALGGSTTEGAKRLAQLGRGIKDSGLGDELARLGYSTEEINTGLATYGARLQKTGALQGMNNAQLVESTGTYLKNLDAVSKLTGQNKADLEKEREARMKDAQYRMMMSKMDAASQENLNMLMDSIPAEHREGMKEILATGNATSEAGKAALAFLPESSRNFMAMNQQIKATGTMSKKSAEDAQALYKKENERLVKSGLAENLANYGTDAQKKFIVASLDTAQQQKNLGQVNAEAQKEAEERKKKEAQLQKDGLDPASLKSYQETIAQVSNEFTKLLASSGLLKNMMDMFQQLTEFVTEHVVPAFKYLAANFDDIVFYGKWVVAGFLALKGIIFAATAVQALQTLGMSAMLPALGAMAVAVWTAIAPLLPWVIAIGAIIAVGYGLFKGFQAIWNAVKDAGFGFNMLTDVLKVVGSYLSEFGSNMISVYYAIMAKITPGKKYEKLAAAEDEKIKQMQAEREEIKKRIAATKNNNIVDRQAQKEQEAREEAEKEAAKKREKELEEQLKKGKKATQDQTATTAAVTEANKKAAEAAEAAKKAAETPPSKPGYDFSSPVKLFESAARRQGTAYQEAAKPPGATTGTAGGTTPAAPIATPPVNQDQAKNMEMIKAALQKQGITDPKYIAATLGNVMKESGGKAVSENMNYSNTSNDRIKTIFGSRASGKSDAELNEIKKDPSKMGEMMYGKDTKKGQELGNTEPGDGFKYRGRGFIQLTGKANYSAASKAIYGDDRLVKNPDMLNDPQVAADVSAWFMKKSQTSMAKSMGIDTKNMTQDQANLLATSQIAGGDVRKQGAYLAGENLNKVNAYASQMTGIAGAPGSTTVAQAGGRDRSGVAENLALYGGGNTGTVPTTAAAQQALANLPDSAKKALDEQKAAEARTVAAANDPRRTDVQNTQVAGAARAASLNDVVASLEMLNTQMGQLLGYTKSATDISERTLSVQRRNTNNLYS